MGKTQMLFVTDLSPSDLWDMNLAPINTDRGGTKAGSSAGCPRSSAFIRVPTFSTLGDTVAE